MKKMFVLIIVLFLFSCNSEKEFKLIVNNQWKYNGGKHLGDFITLSKGSSFTIDEKLNLYSYDGKKIGEVKMISEKEITAHFNASNENANYVIFMPIKK